MIPNSGLYTDLCNYLINKYGYNFGTAKKPITIDENIYLSGCEYSSNGLVTHLSTFSETNYTKLLLYTADHNNTGYAVRLFQHYDEGGIVAQEYLYD